MRKNPFFRCLFLGFAANVIVLTAGAQDKVTDSITEISSRHKFDFKFYPFPLFGGQLPQYCIEIRFAIEFAIAKHQSLQVGFAPVLPGPFQIIGQLFGSIFNDGIPYYPLGGRGIVTYKYYLKDMNRGLMGPYIGAEVSVNGMVTPTRSDIIMGDYYNVLWKGPDYQAHFLMTNYSVTAGYQILKQKRKHKEKKILIDIGASIGYRYDYFWRHYPQGNLEFYRYNGGIYANYYKKVPIGASLNFSIGNFF